MPVSWIDGDIELNHFINTIIYSRDSQSLDEAYRALSSKEKMKKTTSGGSDAKAEGLNSRGRFFEKARVLQTMQDQNLVKNEEVLFSVSGSVTPWTNVLSFKLKTMPRTRRRVPPGKPILLSTMKVELVMVKS